MADRYASLRQGLVGCWIPSISGSGLLLPDLSGRGNNGSLVGMDASDWVSSQYGRALDFDGVNDLVSISTTGQSQFCVSLWFRIRAFKAGSTDGVIFTIDDGANNNLYIAQRASGSNTLTCNGFDGTVRGIYGTGPALSVNTWTHAVCTAANGLYQIYINGIKTTETAGTVIASNANSITIGNYIDGLRPGDQLIDDVRLYNRALTEPEIRLLSSEPGIGFKRISSSAFATRYAYKPAKPRNYSVIRNRDPNYSTLRHGLVAAYCPSISGQGNVLPDLVGGNHGTLTNMTADDWVSSGDGRALDFDGSNDEVIANQSAPVVIAKSCSIAAWVNLPVVTGLVNKTIANFGSNTTGFYSLQFSGSPGRFGFQGWDLTNNAEVTATAFSVVADQWIHVAGVASGGVYKIFINGKQENSQNDPHTVASQTAFRIGNGTGYSAFLSMKCDDVRLYNRGLTEPEIKLLASKRGIGLQPRNTHVTFADLGVQKTYSVVRVKETDYGNLRQGLVGAWCPSLSNGGSGNTLPDQSVYNNHGTLTNMSPDDWVSSQYGRALDFDGSNDYVDTGTQLSFLDGNSEFTMCFWGQRRSSGAALTVGKRSGGNYILIAPWIDGNVYFELSGYFPAVASNLTSWAHYAMTLRGATIRGYINGSQVVSTAGPNTVPSVSANYVMGLEAGVPRYSDGGIDDFRIYNRALSEPEIKLLASRPGIGLRQESHRNTFYQFPSGSRRRRILTGMP